MGCGAADDHVVFPSFEGRHGTQVSLMLLRAKIAEADLRAYAKIIDVSHRRSELTRE
jgi:hypothetical protein